MESGQSDGSRARLDVLLRAVIAAVVLAPGGFMAGYLLGRSLGALLSGCPLRGPCDDAVPVLIAIPTSVIGMGLGCALASTRLNLWWEGVVVWSVGILSMILMIGLVGTLGPDTTSAKFVGAAWLIAALGFGLIRWRREGAS